MTKQHFRYNDPELVAEDDLIARLSKFPLKLAWFIQHGYVPHTFQQLFHTLFNEKDRILRFRHLVAGRRGGKTVSAAWEVVFYCLFPQVFHMDVHGKESDNPLHAWVLTKDYPAGLPAFRAVLTVLREVGVRPRINRADRIIQFENGTILEFKTAVDPQSLRGAGLDILWMDEAAFIPNIEAWDVIRPALADKQGIIFTTTTPSGKNWFWETFFQNADDEHGHVEYRSIDNPYFPREEWEKVRATYHPMLFKQEFMAAFDALQGRELLGEWLKYYTLGDAKDDKIAVPRKENSKEMDLKYFIGVDPAVSLSDKADSFAMAIIGVSPDNAQVFIIDTLKTQIPFPEQVDKVREWFLKWRQRGRGVMFVAVEANAYQRALAQQLERLPDLPPVVPIISKGKKEERILRMAPLFKIGKVRLREDHNDFIDEWLDYDSTLKNPRDDLLDAVEIALSAAGALLPVIQEQNLPWDAPITDLNEWAKRDLPGSAYAKDKDDKYASYDEHMGADW